MKYDCEIIRDLLPLYAEEIASPASTDMVRAHLEECPDCARLLAQMQRPVPVRAETAAPLQKLKKTLWKKRLVTALAVCAVTAVCVGGGYGLYNHTTPVTLEQAALWPFVTQMEGEKVYVVETQGRNVRLEVCPEVGFGGLNAVRAVEITGFRRGVDRLLHLVGADTALDTQAVLRQDQAIEIRCLDGVTYCFRGQMYDYREIWMNGIPPTGGIRRVVRDENGDFVDAVTGERIEDGR